MVGDEICVFGVKIYGSGGCLKEIKEREKRRTGERRWRWLFGCLK